MRFKNVFHTITMTVAALIVTAGSAQASTIIYNFVGTGAAVNLPPIAVFPAEPVALRLIVPDFINPPFAVGIPPNPLSFVSFTCAQLASSTNCRPTGTTVVFSNQGSGPFTANLQFTAVNNVGYSFFFPTGAFAAPGTYNSGGGPNVGTLTVTASIPEPGSIVLILAGICFCGVIRLRV